MSGMTLLAECRVCAVHSRQNWHVPYMYASLAAWLNAQSQAERLSEGTADAVNLAVAGFGSGSAKHASYHALVLHLQQMALNAQVMTCKA